MNTVFIDVDTQLDFLYPSGALYVRGAERLVPVIERLNHYASAHAIPVLSTTDAHAEDDPEFTNWPPHCVAGTLGQHKPAATLLDGRVVIPNSDAAFSIGGARQIVVEKQTLDPFETRTLSPILQALNAGEFVVYGVVAEICVLLAARGLRATGKPVTLLADAILGLSPEDASHAIEEIRASGGKISTVAEICTGQPGGTR